MKAALITDREVEAAKELVSQTEKILVANPWTAFALAAQVRERGLLLALFFALNGGSAAR